MNNNELENALGRLLEHCLSESASKFYAVLAYCDEDNNRLHPEICHDDNGEFLYQPALCRRFTVTSNVNPDLEHIKKAFDLVDAYSDKCKAELYVFLTDMTMQEYWNADLIKFDQLYGGRNTAVIYLSLEELLQRLYYAYEPEWFYEEYAIDELSDFVKEHTDYDMDYIAELAEQLDDD